MTVELAFVGVSELQDKRNYNCEEVPDELQYYVLSCLGPPKWAKWKNSLHKREQSPSLLLIVGINENSLQLCSHEMEK